MNKNLITLSKFIESFWWSKKICYFKIEVYETVWAEDRDNRF